MHFQGLAVASRRFRWLSASTRRRLAHLDSVFAVTRHITEVSCTGFLAQLQKELQSGPPVAKGPQGGMDVEGESFELQALGSMHFAEKREQR